MSSGREPLRAFALFAVLLALVTVAACGGDDTPDSELGPAEWKASVYETVIREIALPSAQAAMPESERPTIYLATSDGSEIGAEAEVLLIGAVKDEVDLKIQDRTTDVIDDGAPDAPVKDHGLLVTVSPLPDQADRVDLQVVLYFDERHVDTVDVTLRRAGTVWTVATSIPAS